MANIMYDEADLQFEDPWVVDINQPELPEFDGDAMPMMGDLNQFFDALIDDAGEAHVNWNALIHPPASYSATSSTAPPGTGSTST